VADGILTMKSTGKAYSSLSRPRHGEDQRSGCGEAARAQRRWRSGQGSIRCRTRPPIRVLCIQRPLEVKAGDWQELQVDLKDSGPLGTLRVYLPDSEIDFIEVAPEKGKAQRWDF
jgi:hypothetical protein